MNRAACKKLARLALVAQRFGYEYADVRQGGGSNSSLTTLLVPELSPQARSRARCARWPPHWQPQPPQG